MYNRYNSYSVQGPFNFSPDGKDLAYLADNSVFVTEIKTGKSKRLTPTSNAEERLTGPVVWCNNGSMLAFNKYVKDPKTGELFLQLFLVKENLQ